MTEDKASSTMNTEELLKVLKETLMYEGGDRPALVARIPLICNDIREIKADLRWMKYIGAGFMTAAGLLALKALGLV